MEFTFRKFHLLFIPQKNYVGMMTREYNMTVKSLFGKFNDLKVLVIGDVMIDSYLWGKADRISPEAPVPVVNVHKRESRLGGAANVALNVLALGATPILCSVVGDDNDSEVFDSLLHAHHLTNEGIIRSKERITTMKHRIMAGSQHMLRVDSEVTHPISQKDANRLFEKIRNLIPKIDVIVFEDYDKGVLTPDLIQKVISEANKQNIPSVVDPKKRNFLSYKNCTLFKPNLKELKEGAQVEATGSNINSIHQGIEKLNKLMPVKNTMVTLSEYGVYITNSKEKHHILAHRREIADVSGAGDTVISIAALCVASNLNLEQIANISNLGGGLVCEFLGVVPIDKEVLLSETAKIYTTL